MEAAFLQAIFANPEDEAARLIYADWLEERGDPRAEFLRLESMLAGVSRDDPRLHEAETRLQALRSGIDGDWLARVDRTDRYTMLWPIDYCRYVVTSNEVEKPLRFVWGGHNQQTRFSFMKVKASDYIYPVRVRDKALYVIARMRVKEVMRRESYLQAHPEDQHLIRNSCAGEVLVGEAGTPINFQVRVPGEMLERLRFRSKKSDRPLKYVKDGQLMNSMSVHGIFRLTARSAQDFDALIRKEYRSPEANDSGWWHGIA
jgi:uncharacterized protein (TIGR02996 family)